ncbi:SDR family NAD(P)-dependent oxidoreductase [Lonsdalea quercina]|uniref:NAD(P)-dependent dehydrogenase, short-chain alcohol dehydrogenase family n=1 Tax=Lonsdalea quercina TaxID=71657 RepID=A0A1H3YDU8_9GAMM|nr:SDR family NAD(P)-dependent oxidoreductase [Lonsdalea quercina]SEA09769.1 NAD(P)-dependent dehydrogenase, short-chain alcohol dehydrogenase family [Lonsdalea quercina]
MSVNTHHDRRLAGKVAIITGAAKGIGRATAELFAAQGAQLMLADVDAAGVKDLAVRLSEHGNKVTAQACDVRHEDDIRRTIDATLAEFGRIDILVANAGIIPEATLEEATAELWDETFAVDARGMFLSAKYAASEMVKAGKGAIVFLSSISAAGGQPGQAVYGPAKFVASGLTKHLAIELAGKGVRVNAVAPGTIDTPAVAGLTKDGIEKVVAMHPLGRMGKPEEIAWGILFLASDEASFITGAVLPIDGGFLAQ